MSAEAGPTRVSAPLFLAPREELQAGERVRLAGPEARHAATVRRLRAGEHVSLTDGAGLQVDGVITGSGHDDLEVEVRARHEHPPPVPRVVVVQALAKGDRDERAVEAMTEAGVDVIVPWAAERCVTRWRPERQENSLARWRAKAREAAKQARRVFLPDVTELAGTSTVAEWLADADLGGVLTGDADTRLASLQMPRRGDVVLVVGPEGGHTPTELAAFGAAGAVSVRLGPTVLRTSTAGLAAAAVVMSRCGRW